MKKMTFTLLILVLVLQRMVATYPSNQPYTSYWFPSEILSWTPQSDNDAIFNKSSVSLKAKFDRTDLVLNPNAKTDQAKIATLDIFGTTSMNPSQGGLGKEFFCFNYWQYVDKMVFWGGSAGEGLILAPNGNVIDAAHKNGVKILGTVFFPPLAYGGNIAWVNEFLLKEGETFPVADKLIEVAQYYGFEGYFINQETAGGNIELATKMKEFMLYFQENSNLELMWYDAMTESGSVSWQDMLNGNNDAFFQNGDDLLAESMFIDFGWNAGKLQTSRTNANNLNRSEFDLFAGVDVQQNCFNTYVNWNALFPVDNNHVTSLGFYVPSSTFHGASSVESFYSRANKFWTGPSGDPTITTSGNWPGLAHYVSAKTAITELPFKTNFCTGQGDFFFLKGGKVSNEPWNNIGIQDILPTWRWKIVSAGTKILPQIDFADAYTGGSSLKLTGELTAENELYLFKSKLNITAETKLRIALKAGDGYQNPDLRIGFAFDDAPEELYYNDLVLTESNEWQEIEIPLAFYNGKELNLITLKLASTSNNCDLNIGEIALYNSLESCTNPDNFTLINKVEEEMNIASARVKWEHDYALVDKFLVYYKNPDNSRIFLGATSNNALYLPKIVRGNSELTGHLEVKAMSRTGELSTADTLSFSWIAANPPEEAIEPNPGDNSSRINLNRVLEWQKGRRATSHDIYLSTTNPPEFKTNTTENYFLAENLEPNTTYYWRVDEKNEQGITTGEIWQFTTGNGAETPLDRTDNTGALITAQGENNGEEKEKAFDNSINTKWLDFAPETWIIHKFANQSKFAISEYTLTSANDAPERDPKYFTLSASNDGENWTILDSRTNISFPDRKYTKTFTFANTTEYEYYKFEFQNDFGNIFQIAEIELFDYQNPTDINEKLIPEKYNLEQNYPNPFNPATIIKYQLPKESQVSINVYDSRGRFVEELVNKSQKAGYYRCEWNGKNYSSGIYYIRQKSGEFQKSIKAVLIK